MSGPELMAVVGFFIMLFGAGWRVWSRVESKVKVAEEKAEKVAADLASHRLHVAEQYVSKQGLRETTDQIMEAIHGVKQAVDHMTMRVDRIVENQAKPRTAAR
jgi:outer membrane protein TolC